MIFRASQARRRDPQPEAFPQGCITEGRKFTGLLLCRRAVSGSPVPLNALYFPAPLGYNRLEIYCGGSRG